MIRSDQILAYDHHFVQKNLQANYIKVLIGNISLYQSDFNAIMSC